MAHFVGTGVQVRKRGDGAVLSAVGNGRGNAPFIG
jgi:hypothetical protein